MLKTPMLKTPMLKTPMLKTPTSTKARFHFAFTAFGPFRPWTTTARTADNRSDN
jgi:hypothetical protein